MKCTFTSPEKDPCPDLAEIGPMCYWHDSSQIKVQPDLKSRLTERARTSKPMSHFSLKYADLSNIDLTNHGQSKGFKLIHSNLYHSNLENTHLFNIDFSDSSLMKANFRGANLHCANLEDANLLGIKLEDAKLEGINWGNKVLQEKVAEKCDDPKQQMQLFSEAEEVYRYIGRILRNNGAVYDSGRFFYREMVSRRKQLPLWSYKRLLSKITDIYCGYGEKPLRLVLFSMMIILIFAFMYSNTGLLHDGQVQRLNLSAPIAETLQHLSSSLYFSVVTFTTLGYGDYSPVGFSRVLASFEAFLGSFTLALFVVVFVRRLAR